MEKKIALDVDGVLLDFYGHLMYKKNLPMEILDTWSNSSINDLVKDIMDDGDFWESIPQLVSPKSITFDFDLYLTHIPEKMVWRRGLNLEKFGFPIKPIVACENKADYCVKNNIDILIDDKDSTIIDCREKGINGILLRPYYYSDKYAKDLNPVGNLMAAIKQFDNTYGHIENKTNIIENTSLL